MILIGTDEGIYRWYEGNPWPIFHSLQGRPVVGLAAPGGGVLAAVDGGGRVLESVDNGMQWRTIPLPEGAGRPSSLAVWGAPSAIVLATKPLGIYRRAIGAPIPRAEDSTASERGLAPRLMSRARTMAEGATALLAPKARPARVDRETAARAGWEPLSSPAVASEAGIAPDVRALTLGAGEPATWYAAVGGSGLWRSVDGGGSWEKCPGLPDEVYAIRTARERPGSVFAATSDGCWVSGDSGQTWEDRSGGLENVRHLRAIEVKPGAPDTLLAGAAPAPRSDSGAAPSDGLGFSLYESTNGGKTWAHVKRGYPETLLYDTITDIRYDPAAPDNVIVALGSGELWVTRNGGAYWTPLARQIRAARVLCAAV